MDSREATRRRIASALGLCGAVWLIAATYLLAAPLSIRWSTRLLGFILLITTVYTTVQTIVSEAVSRVLAGLSVLAAVCVPLVGFGFGWSNATVMASSIATAAVIVLANAYLLAKRDTASVPGQLEASA